METPIDPPLSPQQACVYRIKQEEGEEQSKSEQLEVPEQTSLEKKEVEKTKENQFPKDRREECGSLKESLTGDSNMEQSENERQTLDQEEESQENDSEAMEELLESSSGQERMDE